MRAGEISFAMSQRIEAINTGTPVGRLLANRTDTAALHDLLGDLQTADVVLSGLEELTRSLPKGKLSNLARNQMRQGAELVDIANKASGVSSMSGWTDYTCKAWGGVPRVNDVGRALSAYHRINSSLNYDARHTLKLTSDTREVVRSAIEQVTRWAAADADMAADLHVERGTRLVEWVNTPDVPGETRRFRKDLPPSRPPLPELPSTQLVDDLDSVVGTILDRTHSPTEFPPETASKALAEVEQRTRHLDEIVDHLVRRVTYEHRMSPFKMRRYVRDIAAIATFTDPAALQVLRTPIVDLERAIEALKLPHGWQYGNHPTSLEAPLAEVRRAIEQTPERALATLARDIAKVGREHANAERQLADSISAPNPTVAVSAEDRWALLRATADPMTSAIEAARREARP